MSLKIHQNHCFNLFTCIWIIFFILLFNSLRFVHLNDAPAGFHVDELSAAVTVICIEQEGIDAVGRSHPLFGDVEYGSPKPPTLMYPAALWIKIFGSSRGSFRAINACAAILFIAGLFMLCRQLFGTQYAFFTIFTASISPWVFQMSRILMDAGFAPFYIVWAMYFFFKSRRLRDAFLSGILLALAMYTYPPTRLHVPLLIPLMFAFKWKESSLQWRHALGFTAGLILTIIPLAIKTVSGELTGRFSYIGIFSKDYLASIGKTSSLGDIVPIFISNFLSHFNFSFLFLTGDTNTVYSTNRFGQLSWIDGFALFLGIILLISKFWAKNKKSKLSENRTIHFVIFLLAAILTAIVPSALTWQAIPHSFRIIGVLPFLFMLTGLFIWKAYCKWKYITIALFVLTIGFSYQYLNHYFKEYPAHSYYMFDGQTEKLASSLETPKDWLKFGYLYRNKNYNLRYYFMEYGENHTCSSSEIIYQSLKNLD